MSFLHSIINNLNDVENKYEQEFETWQSLFFLQNFNTRGCCCPNEEICKCKYPLDGKLDTLTNEQIKKVLLFLKEKEIKATVADLDYNYITNELLNTEWNKLVISIFNIDDSDIKEHIKHRQQNKILVFARNYNVLRIISGLGGLRFSN
jgi:hypothetical protein